MTPAPVSISSVSGYVKHVEDNCSDGRFLFRGQPVDKPLLPKIARLVVPENALVAERRMLEDFKRQALPFLDHTPASDWEWLAMAQHFGMATRLLDWTINPLAALWFAVERPATDKFPGVVWYFEKTDEELLDVELLADPFGIDKTRVFQPRHITRRIIAQSGWFTAHRYLETKAKKFVALNNNSRYKSRLSKLVIPPGAFADLRRDLDQFGVNASSLYGGLDGVCRHVEWLHSLMADEKPQRKPKSSARQAAS